MRAHNGYARGSEMAAALSAIDPRPLAHGQIVSSTDRPFDNFPSFIERARGARVWDVDGNEYIDFLLGYGPVILGHGHPAVQSAVATAMDQAVCQAPLWAPAQLELITLLTRIIPGAQMAFVLRTGSDATSCAVRIARIETGRDRIVRGGYNGWHDWANDISAGIPSATRATVDAFRLGSVEALETAFGSGEDVAAIVLMPYEFEMPNRNLIVRARELAHSTGALLILDEVRSGFRVALGGVQQLLDVEADLVCFSKAMANGYCISAVTGSERLLRCLEQTKVSSTFFANRMEQAAAIATITELIRDPPFDHLARLGALLTSGFDSALNRHSVDGRMVGHPASPYLQFESTVPAELVRRTYEACARRGVLLHPTHQWFISAAHTESDIEHAVASFEESLQLAKVTQSGVR